MKIPLLMLFSPSMLYEMTLHPDFDSSPDRQEVLDTLARLEKIRPEDINGKFDWGVK